MKSKYGTISYVSEALSRLFGKYRPVKISEENAPKLGITCLIIDLQVRGVTKLNIYIFLDNWM